MSTTDLVARLQAAAVDTPYAVHSTEQGFRVELDVVDARWWTLLQRNGITKAYSVEGRADEATRTVATTDELRELQWRAGVSPESAEPYLGGALEVQRGTQVQYSFGKQFGVQDDGSVGAAAQWRLDSRELSSWLDENLAAAGWSRARGAEAKVALRVAAGAGVLVALVLLGILLAVLLG